MTMTHMEPYHAMLPPTSFQEAATNQDDGVSESDSFEDDFELQRRLQEMVQATVDDPYLEQQPEQTDDDVSIATDLEGADGGLAAPAGAGDAGLDGASEVAAERASSAGRGKPVRVRSSISSSSRARRKKEKKDKKKAKRDKKRKRRTSSSSRSRSQRGARS